MVSLFLYLKLGCEEQHYFRREMVNNKKDFFATISPHCKKCLFAITYKDVIAVANNC